MAVSYGKKWEEIVKDGIKSLTNFFIYRLYDTTVGYKSIANVGDFIAYRNPYMYVIECKSVEGNTFPFSNLRQYDIMKSYSGLNGVNIGTLIWFVDHKKVCWVDVDEFTRLKELNYKSINIKMLNNDEFNVYEIPSKTSRVFPTCDFSELENIAKNRQERLFS